MNNREMRRARLVQRMGRKAARRARAVAVGCGVCGAAMLSAGAAWIYPPAGLVTMGALLIAVAVEELRS